MSAPRPKAKRRYHSWIITVPLLAGTLAFGLWFYKPTQAEIAAIVKPRWVSRVVSTTLSGEAPADLRLTWRTKPKARAALEDELFGKRLLFTDKDRGLAPIARVVADYRSQEAVEADFRQMKDPEVVSFSPMFHFTDHKIRVHAFYCVIALMVARLMAREADWAQITLPSGEIRRVPAGCRATIGQVGNADAMNVVIGKAGRNRWKGIRPHVRGTAMNPIDHPHGGGEGRTKGGRHPVSPTGIPAKGGRTRTRGKSSNKAIVRRRRSRRYGVQKLVTK